MSKDTWAYDFVKAIGDKADRNYSSHSQVGAFQGRLVSINPIQVSCLGDEIQLRETDGEIIFTESLRKKLSDDDIGRTVLLVGDQVYYAIDFI